MKPKFAPTGEQLRLGSPKGNQSLDDQIAAIAGDPAYLHELVAELEIIPARKQVADAMLRLLRSGRIVCYGHPPRRLYATSRVIHPDLVGFQAGTIRVLQYLPLAGPVTQSMFERRRDGSDKVFGHVTSALNALSEAGSQRALIRGW